MTKTAETWTSSPARELTLANHLPKTLDGDSELSVADTETLRQDAAIDVINISGLELGRTSAERRLYLDTAGERYGQVRFLAQAEELRRLQQELTVANISLDDQSPEVKNAIKADVQQLNELSERLFGAVDPERFEAIIARTRYKAHDILNHASEKQNNVVEAARRVLDYFPNANQDLIDTHIHKPSQDLLEHWKPFVKKKYASLLELVNANVEHNTSEELVNLFNEAILIMANDWSLPNAGSWKAAIGGLNVSVDMEKRTVWVPPKQNYTPEKAQELLVHEPGGHLLRNLLGELSGNPLLATDMPGRGSDEEALLVALQQTLTGKSVESGLDYYVAVGLAAGVIDGNRTPLKDLEPHVLDYRTVTKGASLSDKEISTIRQRVLRIRRGMPSFQIDGILYEATYNADLKYAIGQQNAVKFLEENRDNPRALDDAMLGKFAYSNPDHMAYALQYARRLPRTAVPSVI